MFEDYLFYLKLFNLHLNGKIKMCHTNNSYMYVYDKANEHSVSTKNFLYSHKEINILRGFAQRNKMMDKHPREHLPFVKLGVPMHFNLKDKVLWVRMCMMKYPADLKSLDPEKDRRKQLSQVNQQRSPHQFTNV